MNRELKFRAWVTAKKDDWFGCDNYETFDWNNRMRKVCSVYFPLGSFSGKDITLEEIEVDGEDNYSTGWTSIEDCHLMQFTGFKDINGVEIYEGDILSDSVVTDERIVQSNQQVFWNEHTGSWHLDLSFKKDTTYSCELWQELNDFKYKVVGNIFEV